MQIPNQNPLAKHFRQPAIYIKLPSGGQFYPDGSLELPVTGELPVYPMTAKDEITLKTPDSLMNGSSMAQVIFSCCPNIKDPWAIPAVDLDAIFIAIRLASYGTALDISSTCPHCKAENDNSVNLTALLENIKPLRFDNQVKIRDLVFTFRPQTFKQINETNIFTFEQRQLINNTLNSDLPEEEKQLNFKASFDRLSDLNVKMLVNSIENITTPEGTIVSDPAMIHEFLTNADSATFSLVRETIERLNKQSRTQDAHVSCEECKKEYDTALVLDNSNFFE